MSQLRIALATPPRAGAVAIIDLWGPGTRGLLVELTGREQWSEGRLTLCSLAGVDEGLAVLLQPRRAQVMPHGGPRVVERVLDRAAELGALLDEPPSPVWAYPEAADTMEAHVLATLARAVSPAAVDLLLAQPPLWRRLLAQPPDAAAARCILADSDRLDRLVNPPTVALLGRPNVGKSTLTNRLLGGDASVVCEQAGTTRDWVGAVAHLRPGPRRADAQHGSIAVYWIDTPGLRDAADPIERHAIAMARPVAAAADLRIAMRDDESDWPEAAFEHGAGLWLVNKIDRPPAPSGGDGRDPNHPLPISAQRGDGIATLEAATLSALGLLLPDRPTPWAFDAQLRSQLRAAGG